MYLSRLDLHGFKSFAQKTSVAFSPGVTAIVGPNGCGKSNVIDAVRWVLGEQRARLLRSDSMGGVIFNGAAGRRPLGMAEVSLTVQNTRGVLPTEYAEVTVTRRLYRNGDSDYLLNGTVCRLRDVLDLFMDTGMGAGAYSVIELSMVEDILSENAADRRRLFEEAAGVTKYKRRREQTFKKLAATQQDLTRLDDIVDEVEKQVRSLERQAGKARTHARLAAQLRTLDLALASHDAHALAAERAARQAEAGAAADAAERLGAQIATAEATAEADRTALVGLERALADHAVALAAHADRVAAVDAERRVEAERAAGAERALDRLAQEAAEADDRAAALARSTEDTTTRLAEATAQARTTAGALAQATEARDQTTQAEAGRRRALDAARSAADAAARALADARAARDRTADRRQAAQDEAARLEEARAGLGADDGDAARAARDATATTQAALEQAEAAVARLASERDTARETEAARRDAEQAARSARDAARAEADLLDALLDAGDGDGDALDVLRQRLGAETVAELVGCDDADRLALAAALAPYAEAVVVQTDADADAAIAALGGAGRATLLVLDRLAPRPPSGLSPAVPALTVARASDARAETLLRALLGNAFVAPDLGAARRLQAAHPDARFVTRAGESADAVGAVHVGSAAGAARLGLRERQTRAAGALARAEAHLAKAAAQTEAARQTASASASRSMSASAWASASEGASSWSTRSASSRRAR